MIPVGITAQTTEAQRDELNNAADEVVKQLISVGVRVESDLRWERRLSFAPS